MAPFQPRWSADQRDAMMHAIAELGMTTGAAIRAGAAGELRTSTGAELEPFTMPYSTARDLGVKAMRRRNEYATRAIARAPARDHVDLLRRRLVCATDVELERLERSQRGRRRPLDGAGEKLRQLARATREIAAIPLPGDAPARAPGSHVLGSRAAGRPETDGGKTRGGLAGAILAAHAGSGLAPAPTDPPTNTSSDGEGCPTDGAGYIPGPDPTADGVYTGQDGETPGSYARDRIAALQHRSSGP